MNRSNVSRSHGAKDTLIRVVTLSVIGALMSAVILFFLGLVDAVLFGLPSGDGGGQAGFVVVMAILAGAVFVASIPICAVGGAIVSLILAGVSRSRGIRQLTGLAVGAPVGLAVGLVVAGILVLVTGSDSRHDQFQDAREFALLCIVMATPVGSWFGWVMARWFGGYDTIK